jgi:hypothetical protein
MIQYTKNKLHKILIYSILITFLKFFKNSKKLKIQANKLINIFDFCVFSKILFCFFSVGLRQQIIKVRSALAEVVAKSVGDVGYFT